MKKTPTENPRSHRGLARKLATVLIIGLCTSTVAALVAATNSESIPSEEPAPAPALAVHALTLETQNAFEFPRVYVGRVEAKQRSSLAFEVAGVLEELRFREGDRVERGALLATLDTERLDARRETLVAALDRAVADRDRIERDYRRVLEAFEQNAASVSQRDNAELLFTAARATEAEAQGALAALDIDIEKSRLVAPFAGVVDRRLVDAGQGVSAGEGVFVLLESGSPEVRLGLSANALAEVTVGDVIDVEVGGRSLRGRISRTLSSVDAGSRLVDVFVELGVDLPEVMHGDIARCVIPIRREAAGYWVPTSALAESDRGTWSVYRFAPDAESQNEGAVTREPVRVLHAGDDRCYVEGAFSNGNRIVSRGLHRLSPGMRVSIAAPSLRAGDAR